MNDIYILCKIELYISILEKINIMTQRTLTQFGYKSGQTKKTMCDFVLDYNTMESIFTDLEPPASLNPSLKLHTTIKSRGEGFAWRIWSTGQRDMIYAPTTTENDVKWDAPVLKSNLQKAIRRQDREAALSSTLQLALIDKQELLRRLPIITIEDVCLIKGTATIVWLMMAAKNDISLSEINFILRYVDALCFEKNVFFNNKSIKVDKTSHIQIAKNVELAALNIRASYGGMKGDMQMLMRAVKYYEKKVIAEALKLPDPMARIPELELPKIVSHDFILLSEGIDFHPYPWILSYIFNKTNIPKDQIKSIIWNAESGPNNRKSWTIEKQTIAKNEDIWLIISEYLEKARNIIITKHYTIACDV